MFCRSIAVGLCLVFCAQRAFAVLVLGGRDANGTLNNSGRNLNPAPFNLDSYEGQIGPYTGTPIAPHYFITAAHIGGGAGSQFTFDGTSYTAVSVQTQNDLAVFETDPNGPAFPITAPLYTNNNEAGQQMVVIGRGGPRGSTVTVNGTNRGWQWSPQDGAGLSWGEQTVDGAVTDPSNGAQYLTFSIGKQTDGNGNVTNPDQSGVSVGDSGGGLFVKDPSDGVFKLAGITYGADGSFNVLPASDPNYQSSQSFNATMFDASGLYYAGTDQQVPTDEGPQPTSSYDSRISSSLDFIDGVTGLPEPSVGAILIAVPMFAARRGRRRRQLSSTIVG